MTVFMLFDILLDINKIFSIVLLLLELIGNWNKKQLSIWMSLLNNQFAKRILFVFVVVVDVSFRPFTQSGFASNSTLTTGYRIPNNAQSFEMLNAAKIKHKTILFSSSRVLYVEKTPLSVFTLLNEDILALNAYCDKSIFTLWTQCIHQRKDWLEKIKHFEIFNKPS